MKWDLFWIYSINYLLFSNHKRKIGLSENLETATLKLLLLSAGGVHVTRISHVIFRVQYGGSMLEQQAPASPIKRLIKQLSGFTGPYNFAPLNTEIHTNRKLELLDFLFAD